MSVAGRYAVSRPSSGDPAMTDKELARLDALIAAATDGPWEAHELDHDEHRFDVAGPNLATICVVEEFDGELADDEVGEQVWADFQFIAAARSAMPRIIKAYRELKEQSAKR